MSSSKPIATRTTHVLPFDQLSPLDFERLCLAVLAREGFDSPQHYGAAGGEQGRDIVARRGGDLWYVQCKRVKECGAKVLLDEVEKVKSLVDADPDLRSVGVLFIVACDVHASARDRVETCCSELGLRCEVWGRRDLDARVHRYPDILGAFFDMGSLDGAITPDPRVEASNKTTRQPNASIARIADAQGKIRGTGFLVSADGLVVSCAHVVAQAMGLAECPDTRPELSIWLDFPLLAPRQARQASVAAWHPPRQGGDGDIAVVASAGTLPGGARPAPLTDLEDLWGHPWRAFGFPKGYDAGVWASGHILGRDADGWLQIEDTKTTGYFIQPGFSGGPLWDDELRAVVGMIVAADQPQVRSARAIPAAALLAAMPGPATGARPPVPPTPPATSSGRPGVFISHRGQDAALARQLAEEVEQAGFEVWLDEWNIAVGNSIMERIDAGLETARYVVVCYSDAGVLSPWMSREWMSVLARQLEGQQVKLLPVRLSGGRPPAILADIRYADLVKDWDQGVADLILAMR